MAEDRFVVKKVLSSDGKHMLNGRVYYPEGTPKGLLHVVHGMTEYIARYDRFMTRMCDEGYVVFGYDHLGHGRTAENEDELGFIAHKDGWKRLAEDVGVFANEIKKDYPDLPYYMMGHSMGSFIVRIAAKDVIVPDKLIVMGTSGPNPAAGPGLFLTKVIKLFRGEKHRSLFLCLIAFGSYNKKFKEEKDIRSWLTKDPESRDKYRNDKYCTYIFTTSAFSDLMKLIRNCNSGKWFKGFPEKVPVMLVSGGDDPVGNYGKGVTKVYDKLKKAGKDAKMKLYPNNRHEILNDTAYDEVTADIIDFLK